MSLGTPTTLSGAIALSDTQIRLASGTGIAAGKILKVNGEKMKVLNADIATSPRVSRGLAPTAAQAHASGSRVVSGDAADFPVRDAAAVYQYSAAGAVNPKPGQHQLKTGTAGAMTLRDPTADEEGVEFEVAALDAQAYTLTYTAGFAGGTTSNDVATWGGAIGDSMKVKCVDGGWRHTNLQGVTVA